MDCFVKTNLLKDIDIAANHCVKDDFSKIFENWKFTKISLIYLYGKNKFNKYEPLLRNKFVQTVKFNLSHGRPT